MFVRITTTIRFNAQRSIIIIILVYCFGTLFTYRYYYTVVVMTYCYLLTQYLIVLSCYINDVRVMINIFATSVTIRKKTYIIMDFRTVLSHKHNNNTVYNTLHNNYDYKTNTREAVPWSIRLCTPSRVFFLFCFVYNNIILLSNHVFTSCHTNFSYREMFINVGHSFWLQIWIRRNE